MTTILAVLAVYAFCCVALFLRYAQLIRRAKIFTKRLNETLEDGEEPLAFDQGYYLQSAFLTSAAWPFNLLWHGVAKFIEELKQ